MGTDPKCCPETQIPWCYVGLAQTEEQETSEEIKQQETSEETEKQETSEKDQKAIEEAYPGCAGVCRKPGSALCFASNPFTKYDVGPSCGNINSAHGCAHVGDILKQDPAAYATVRLILNAAPRHKSHGAMLVLLRRRNKRPARKWRNKRPARRTKKPLKKHTLVVQECAGNLALHCASHRIPSQNMTWGHPVEISTVPMVVHMWVT